MKSVSMLVIIFLLMISALHFLRLVLQIEVVVGGTVIPVWLSFFGGLITAVLATLLWRENKK